MPASLTTVKTFVVYPPGFPDSMKDRGLPLPPTATCGLLTETTSPSLSLSQVTNPDGSITVSAQATDNQAIKEVDFFLDGSSKPQRLSAGPYTFTVTGKPGSVHSVVVQAYNYNPANAPASQSVTVTIGQPASQ